MTRRPEFSPYHRTAVVGIPGWAAGIGAILAGALGIAVFLASASLLLMLAPVVIGIVFYVRWRIRRALRKMADEQRRYDDSIIDGDYRVINEDQDRLRP